MATASEYSQLENRCQRHSSHVEKQELGKIDESRHRGGLCKGYWAPLDLSAAAFLNSDLGLVRLVKSFICFVYVCVRPAFIFSPLRLAGSQSTALMERWSLVCGIAKVLRNDLKKAQAAFEKNEHQKAQDALESVVERISIPKKGRWSKGSVALKQLLDELFAVSHCWLNSLHTRHTHVCQPLCIHCMHVCRSFP